MAGYVITSIAGIISAFAFFQGKKDPVKWAAGVGVIFDLTLLITYICCSRRTFITIPKYPEWTKARIWGSPAKERYTVWRLP